MKINDLFYQCAYTIPYKQIGDSVNYAFVEKDTTLYIYFQGSNSISDWVRNFLFPKKPYKDMETPYKVHRGFLQAWKEIEDLIIKTIKDPKWQTIVVVGYSHGGALSGLCYECVWYHRADLRHNGLIGYGFESPRFYGGFKVKEELKERWENYYVIQTNNDIVCHCPPKIFGFTNVGKLIKVKGDTNLVKNKLPKFIKSHYPQVVYNALKKFEEN